MKQARATSAWHQRHDTNNNLHQTQTTVEIKFRNVLLLWVYQREKATHAETYIHMHGGQEGEKKGLAWWNSDP